MWSIHIVRDWRDGIKQASGIQTYNLGSRDQTSVLGNELETKQEDIPVLGKNTQARRPVIVVHQAKLQRSCPLPDVGGSLLPDGARTP